ncbi:hypothetical protein P5V15_014401 [Pogonomyrmex californicus]
MLASKKLMLTSEGPQEQWITSRKPVKGCYCYSEMNKMHIKSRNQHKSVSCPYHCKSEFKFRSIREIDDKVTLPSSSCEIFKRIQKINYTPRSQFLRNIQSKICELRDQGDHLWTCPQSSNYHRSLTNARMQNTFSDEKIILQNECKCVDEKQKTSISPIVSTNSIANEQNKSKRDDVVCTLNKKTRVSPRKLSKSTRKTIRFRKQILDSSEKYKSKSSMQSKKTTQLCKQDCSCRSELNKKIDDNKCENAEKQNLLEHRDRYLRHEDDSAIEDSMDREIEDMRKFRQQNFFETHSSNHALTSSKSELLQQYLLNERLFPEPMGKIQRQNLMVTISPCTTQRKCVHYFPRYVVQQEKSAYNTNYIRKRCQSCPLIGHAVDLGILKTRPPLNSLALKYQKRAL